jgi:hypothetical protein
MKKQGPHPFETTYPAITRWVEEFGRVEIGTAGSRDNFVKAIDRDGIPWGGKGEYESIDEALRDMEQGLKSLLEAQGPHKRSSARQRPTKRSAKKARKDPTKAGRDQPLSDDERKVIKKVEKLDGIAEELRRGGHFSITRLTTIKSLCEDPEAAGAFALFLARKIQKRMREEEAPKRYRELVNRAVRELKPYLDDPAEERRERLRSLSREIEAEQDEYENIPWGVVRNVKSFDLLVVEHALKAVLRGDEATFWLYHAARDYTGRTDELVPRSAPMVEEIAGFWRKHFGIKR